MKKFAIVLATTILLLSLTACSKDDSSSKDRSEESTDVVEETEETEEAEETETTETPKPTETSTSTSGTNAEVDLVFEDGQNVVYAEDLGFNYDECLYNSSDNAYTIQVSGDFNADGETEVLSCLHPGLSDAFYLQLEDVDLLDTDTNSPCAFPYAFVKSSDGHVHLHTIICGGNDLYFYEVYDISCSSVISEQSIMNTTNAPDLLSSDINNLNMIYAILPGGTFERTFYLDDNGMLASDLGYWTPSDDNYDVVFDDNYTLDLVDDNGEVTGSYDVNEETVASYYRLDICVLETDNESDFIYLRIDDSIVRIPYDYYGPYTGELYEDQGVNYTRLHLEGL